MERLSRLDRRLGRAVRAAVGAIPGGPAAARAIAAAMSPAFRLVVAAMILRRPTRATGLRCLAAAVTSAMAARLLRDRLGRARPGTRAEGGFPSRHAAASAAIAGAAATGAPRAGRALAAAATLGMAARVAAAEHDPADIVAGAALGAAGARAVGALTGASRVRPPS